MMEIWTAFILGMVGSLHCAAMCGPLALALPATCRTGSSFVAGRLAYNGGRILTYCSLGAIFGLIGKSVIMAGLQRWLSLGVGTAVLICLIASSRRALRTPAGKAVAWVKSGLARLLQHRTLGSQMLCGALNGLLPCGLVYVAAAGATASGEFLSGIGYMFAFGVGTLPMMLAVGVAGRGLNLALRLRLQKLIPFSVGAVGVLLILRGMSLGIPFLSPHLTGDHRTCPACF